MKHNAKKARNLAYMCLIAGVIGGSFIQIPRSEAEDAKDDHELWAMYQLVLERDREIEALNDRIYELEEKSPVSEVKAQPARLTAYSCGGLATHADIMMNCPSLFNGEPKTANGTTPVVGKTMACDPANMGRTFHIEGIGERTCTDTGGAITGAGRFDIYVDTVEEARQFGVQYRNYR